MSKPPPTTSAKRAETAILEWVREEVVKGTVAHAIDAQIARLQALAMAEVRAQWRGRPRGLRPGVVSWTGPEGAARIATLTALCVDGVPPPAIAKAMGISVSAAQRAVSKFVPKDIRTRAQLSGAVRPESGAAALSPADQSTEERVG